MAEKWETEGIGETNYHSSRTERHDLGGIGEMEKLGFFQKNPSFKMLIIDLILIVIISGVLVPYLYKREGTSSLEGYKLNLRAFYFDDSVMVSLTVTGREDSSEPGAYMDAVFRSESPGESVSVSDITPRDGQERILKAELKDVAGGYVFCLVTINGENKTIKKKIK